MEHIISPDDVVKLGRPIGTVEKTKLLAYITEAEQMNVKPALGDELFLSILSDGEENDLYKVLLNGGTYKDSRECIHTFVGLKVTMSYYVYAQNVMTGDFQSTRFGTVVKQGDYSREISSKERSDCYNNALEVAHHYLKECVDYCKAKGLFKTNKSRRVVSTGGCTIRKIGN